MTSELWRTPEPADGDGYEFVACCGALPLALGRILVTAHEAPGEARHGAREAQRGRWHDHERLGALIVQRRPTNRVSMGGDSCG